MFFEQINDFAIGLLASLGLTASSHTKLYTDDVDGVLVSDNASLMSLLRLDGSLKLMGQEEFAALLENLTRVLSQPLSSKAHALHIVFTYDPSQQCIKKDFERIRASARAMDLDLTSVLTDWEHKLEQYIAYEAVYIAFWTKKEALTRLEQKTLQKSQKKLQARHELQNTLFDASYLRDRHISNVTTLVKFFKSHAIQCTWLSSAQSVTTLRAMLDPKATPSSLKPKLSNDSSWINEDCLAPTIASQIWTHPAKIIGDYVQIADMLFAPISMRIPPQTRMPFSDLFMQLAGTFPWRASFFLSGDGFSNTALKDLFAQILTFSSPTNAMISKAYTELKESALSGTTLVGFQACFCTWVFGSDTNALKTLAKQSARLQSHIQTWGSPQTQSACGDPLLFLSATLPGSAPLSPAPKAIAPLQEALSILPLTRTSSVWKTGDLPLRTPDGKFMPIALFHSKQASWNEVVFAGMGAGKSFFLNTLNFFFLLRAGQTSLPWLTIIDIGSSCSGVITLIQTALPKEKQYLACFAKLRNTARHAINPFDTPLGCSYPLRSHMEFLTNLLSLLCTPLEATAPADGVTSLMREACDILYKRLSPKGLSPKHFDPYIDANISESLKTLHFHYDANTLWWDIVDFFFDHGLFDLASKAQRYCMPVLADLAQIVNEHNVSENYTDIAVGIGGEQVPKACSRYLISAIQEYPMLANVTQFSLGEAKIVGLDLNDVTPRGGIQSQRQSGIMYMMARFVGAAKFFMNTDDLNEIPEKYRPYHRPKIEELMSHPKRLCYDEFHRASCQDMNNPLSRQIISDLTTAARESRKLNLSIGLYSQRLQDFPKELVAMATSIYALGAANANEAEEIATRFGFNDAAKKALRHITRPSEKGADCVALYKTSDGECIQYLTNSAGSFARWAFSTTAEDMHIRNRLYAILGSQKALQVLAQVYPSGSVKEEIERRKTENGENCEVGEDIEERIFEELVLEAKKIR